MNHDQAELVSGPERICPSLGSPYQASRGSLFLTFHLVTEPADREGTYALRHRVYQGSYEYLLRNTEGLALGEDEYDSDSLLFCCRQGEKVVAACRFTPKLGNGWELTEPCAVSRLPQDNVDRLLQVSRVVVHPEFRGYRRGYRISEVMMYFCCHWLVQDAKFSFYFAVCLPPLVRFYRHFGVQVFSPEALTLPGRGENRYFLVYGSFLDSLRALRSYLADSWDLSPDTELPQNGPAGRGAVSIGKEELRTPQLDRGTAAGAAPAPVGTERLAETITLFQPRSPLADIDEELRPVHGCETANFNAAAAAPESLFVQRFTQGLSDGYQRSVPGSLAAREYLRRLRSECEALLRNVVLRDFRGNFVIGLFPGTSRAMEAALGASGTATEIILSPYEHQVEMEVARWMTWSSSATVTRIQLRPAEYEEPWESQRARLLAELRRRACDAIDRGRFPTIVLSQVFWANGTLLPVQEVVDDLERSFGASVRVIIDGAHVPGNTAATDLGDFHGVFVLSAHKWLLSPEPCGVLVWPGTEVGRIPYDAWLFEPPATTCGIRMIASLRSGLEVFRKFGFEAFWSRSRELRYLFEKSLPEGIDIVGRESGLSPTCMLAVRPATEWRWIFDQAEDLRSYFNHHAVSVTVVQIDISTLWVRIAFFYFLGERDIERLCKILDGATVQVENETRPTQRALQGD